MQKEYWNEDASRASFRGLSDGKKKPLMALIDL